MSQPFDPTLFEPRLLWEYFAALSAIPRGSGNEAAVMAYVKTEAERLGLTWESDEVGNVLVRKPATPGREGDAPVALQGHVDMVCEKNRDTVHDFTTDPIRLQVDGEWLKATGTTLGADNGIGVAAGLALMAMNDASHGPLECLFTVDEERGLTGASGLKSNWLNAKYLLNLDSEDPSELTISCAGGLETLAQSTLGFNPAPAGTALALTINGLKGGHSGVDIHLGRGNAIRILARTLDALLALPGTAVAALEGGSRRNVIPREGFATVIVSDAAAAQAVVAKLEADVRAELGSFDPNVRIALAPAESAPATVFAPADLRRLVDLLLVLPYGPHAMSSEIEGLVQTSSNLAVVTVNEGRAVITLSHRGALASAKDEAGRVACLISRAFGFEATLGGAYPGWAPLPTSRLVEVCQGTYTALHGKPAEIRAIHAGLECGILGDKHPGMQMISFGPKIVDAHSPAERVHLGSVTSFWAYLLAVLKAL